MPRTVRCVASDLFVRIDACLDGDAAEIARLVVRASGLERTIPDAGSSDADRSAVYRSLWAQAPTGRTFARRAEPESHDWTLTPSEMSFRIAGSRALMALDGEVGIREIELTIEGSHARWNARLGLSLGVESGDEVMQSGRFVRSAGAWRIEHLRSWPAIRSDAIPWVDEEDQPAPALLFDEAYWARVDRSVEEARDAHRTEPTTRARRRLGAALALARRIPEAFEVVGEIVASGEADSSDWRRRAQLAVDLGRLEEARFATDQIPRAPAPPVERWASMQIECDAELDEDSDRYCSFQTLHRLEAPEGSPFATVAVFSMDTGVAEPAGRTFVGVAARGEWRAATEVGSYVMAGNYPVGPIRFALTDPRLVQLDAEPGPELRADYEELAGVDDGGTRLERGVLVCGHLTAEPRCARLPTFMERRDRAGDRTSVARADLRFEQGAVFTRRLRGRDRLIRPGRRTLEEVLARVDAAPD